MKRLLIALTVGASLGLVFHSVNATTFPNVAGPGPDLPNGAVSFADSVTDFVPGIVIDAIAAISTTPIPIPAAVWLYGSALGLLGWLLRKSL